MSYCDVVVVCYCDLEKKTTSDYVSAQEFHDLMCYCRKHMPVH